MKDDDDDDDEEIQDEATDQHKDDEVKTEQMHVDLLRGNKQDLLDGMFSKYIQAFSAHVKLPLLLLPVDTYIPAVISRF